MQADEREYGRRGRRPPTRKEEKEDSFPQLEPTEGEKRRKEKRKSSKYMILERQKEQEFHKYEDCNTDEWFYSLSKLKKE